VTTSNSPQAGGARHHPVLAALTLCLGVFVFALQDWIIKKISGGFPVHQAIIIRCIVALPILLILVRIQGRLGDLISPKLRWLVLRGVILVVSYTTYYLAFPAMPLANVIALWFTTPLFVTALAGPLLGETVGAKRWAAAIIGFIGVLIMVRPFTDGFDAAGLLPIISALSYGTAQLMARRMGVTETAAVMSFYQNLVFLLVATVMALLFGDGRFAGSADPSLEFLFRAWAVPEGWDLLLLGLCGIIASAGMVLLTQAYRMAEANFVTSFEYTAIIWATLGGWWFWNEIPDKLTLVGALLIVGAGLYMLYGARPSSAVEIEPI